MSKQDRGRFISLEGVEGAGKSTQLAYIEQYLRDTGISLVVTREPGGTPLAEEIREMLLQPREDGMTDKTELLLMFAARADHLEQKILPALAEGKWVLSDRFTDATYAYQGGGRGIDVDIIARLEDLVQGQFRPDLTLLLDVPVDVGLARAGNRSAPDRFEQEKLEFFERVRAAYLAMAEATPARYRVVDAAQSLDSVQLQLETVLADLLNAS